jgi:hypothetical protein
VIAIAKVDEVRVGKPDVETAMAHFKDGHQPVLPRIRQRPQQDSVDDRKDSGGGADGEGQREYRDY